jgi:putative tryptophan/tyrosine transport system substrate-binding protein
MWLSRLLVALIVVALCTPVEAQQPKKIPLIGFLGGASSSFYSPRISAFREGLRDHGYVEGKNIALEYLYAEGRLDQLPALAAELVCLKVNIIVSSGVASLTAKNATTTIPIVFVAVADAVDAGLVISLARPGGNATGLTILAPELNGKQLEVLKETFPNVTHVALVWNPSNPSNSIALKETKAASQSLALQIRPVEVGTLQKLEEAFESTRAVTRAANNAIITLADPAINAQERRILDFAAKNRVAAMYAVPEFVNAGGLMSYAPSYIDEHRRAATYVDKILKGAKPAELPVEQPTKFEFIINLKTAKEIGLTIPPNVLARADKVIR